MQHYRSLDGLHLHDTWLSVGTFDGVHRGHRALLEPMATGAHAAGVQAAVVTFFPHPAVVLRGLQTPYYLTSPDERAALLGQAGIDVVVTLEFNHSLAALSAHDFVSMLSRHLGLRQIWAGADFALGHNREGNLAMLERIGEELGYSIHVVEPLSQGERPISSSQVRALLAEGNVREAGELLGRRYTVSGPVVHGDGRGHSIGIPTANIQTWEQKILPANGVYACRVLRRGERLRAVTNVGVRPTFEDVTPRPRVEAHLLDFNQDLYGQQLELEFVEHLRPEEKFASVPALLEQIHKDIQHAAEVLELER
jgi:riboflavin kinase/FMN adenylyltransferase